MDKIVTLILPFSLGFGIVYCGIGEKGELKMAFVISSDCIACGACESECPASSISEGDDKYVVNADTCTECGSCAEVCPVGAPAKA